MKQNKIPRNEYIRKPVGKTNPYKEDTIYTDMGQWKYPGQVTKIPSGDITMQGVPYPVYGEDNLGYSQMMYPGMDYTFPGQYVTEYPQIARNGGGLLNKTLTCPSCGWSWKAVDGGKDIATCHKCGSTVKLAYGGIPMAQDGWESKINKALGQPMKKAQEASKGDKWFNPKTKKWEQEDDVDNFRHPMAGRYTAEAITNKFPSWLQYTGIPQAAGFVGANALGIGHEITNPNKDPNYSWWDVVREAGEDIFNNAVGAGVGVLPMSADKKTEMLWNLSKNNRLPDGYAKANMYFKAYGGDPSLPNIEDHYPFGGQNTKTHTHMVQGGGLNDLPKAQDGLFNTLYAKLNPYNWGVPDYSGSDELGKWDWSTANYVARDRGDKEFMHNNKRYAVKDKRKKENWETAEEKNPEFFKNYAKNYLKSVHPEDYEKRYKDLLSTHYRYGNPYVTIEKPGLGGSGNYGRAYFEDDINQMHIYGLHQNPNITKIDTANLMSDYAQELLHARQLKDLGEKGFSKHIQEDLKRNNVHYEPSTKKWVNYDETMYTDPKSIEGVHYTQGNALWDRLMWRSYYTEEDPDKKEDRDYYLNYYKNRKFHPYEDQNNLRTLQKALSEAGYDMSESLKKDGTYDGIYGEQTKNALYNWQKGYTPTPVKKSNVTISAAPTYNKKYGGWLDKLQKGGRTPIYVNDPNDIRLRMFQDSLKLVTNYAQLRNKLSTLGYKNYTKELDDIPSHKSESDLMAAGEAEREGTLWKTYDFYPSKTNKDLGYQYFSPYIRPKGEEYWRKRRFAGDARLVYDYSNVMPKQPVIYDPSKASTNITRSIKSIEPIAKKAIKKPADTPKQLTKKVEVAPETVPQEIADYLQQKQMSLPTQQQEPELRIPTTPKDTTANKRIAWRQDPNTKKMVPLIGGMKEKVKDMKRLYNKYIPSSGGAIPADFIPDYGDVVTFQNGGLLDKMQKGGRTPIVVDDKNNPKFKSYTDSLALYNLSQKAKKLFDVDPMDPTLEGYNKKANALASKSKIKPTKLQLSGYSQDYPKNFDPGAMEEPWMVTYKKPVQPYIYKKPEEKEQSRTDVYTDKALFDKAYKAEMDSINVRKTADQTFKPGNKTRPLTNKEKEEWKDEKTGLYPNLVEYNSGQRYFGHFKKPVVHNVYEEPIKEQSKKAEPKKTEAKKDYATRNVDFSSPNGAVMKYYDAAGKVIRTEPYVLPQKQEGGWLDKYQDAGQLRAASSTGATPVSTQAPINPTNATNLDWVAEKWNNRDQGPSDWNFPMMDKSGSYVDSGVDPFTAFLSAPQQVIKTVSTTLPKAVKAVGEKFKSLKGLPKGAKAVENFKKVMGDLDIDKVISLSQHEKDIALNRENLIKAAISGNQEEFTKAQNTMNHLMARLADQTKNTGDIGGKLGTAKDVKQIAAKPTYKDNPYIFRDPETNQIVYNTDPADFQNFKNFEMIDEAKDYYRKAANDWLNKEGLNRSGYTDVPGFNQELNYLKAQAQYGKRPLEKVTVPEGPHFNISTALSGLDEARFEEGITDIIPKKFIKGSKPFKTKEAFQQLSPNKYGGPMTPPKLKKKAKKYGTSKNIQSSINKIFLRNQDIFGPSGRNIYNPNSKFEQGGGWLDKYNNF